MFRLYRIVFALPRKKKIPDRASVHTNKHGCGSAKLRRADLVLVERHTSDKDTGYCFVPYSGAVWTPLRPVAEVNKLDWRLEPTETEVNILELGLGFNEPNLLGQLRQHDVRCVWTACAASSCFCTYSTGYLVLCKCILGFNKNELP